jgi:NADPH2:quinone reductase
MRAVVCNQLGPPKDLQVEDRDDLRAGPGQVIVDVLACGVNFVDALIVQGLYQLRAEPPFVPGSEVAGRVREIGEGVEGVALGHPVVALPGLGGFAEQVAVGASALLEVPAGLDMPTAACTVQSYCTALFALERRGGLRAGETLLVLGAAGGVGLAAIDVARALGARVIAAASSPEKLALCRERGAHETIDYAREDLKVRAKELSRGGVDVVYDPVGGELAEAALRACAPGARYLVIGFASGEIPRIRLNLVLLKSCQIVGVDWGGTAHRDRTLNPALLADLRDWIESGRISPRAPACFPLEQAGRVLADLAERRLAGKAALLPGSSSR